MSEERFVCPTVCRTSGLLYCRHLLELIESPKSGGFSFSLVSRDINNLERRAPKSYDPNYSLGKLKYLASVHLTDQVNGMKDDTGSAHLLGGPGLDDKSSTGSTSSLAHKSVSGGGTPILGKRIVNDARSDVGRHAKRMVGLNVFVVCKREGMNASLVRGEEELREHKQGGHVRKRGVAVYVWKKREKGERTLYPLTRLDHGDSIHGMGSSRAWTTGTASMGWGGKKLNRLEYWCGLYLRWGKNQLGNNLVSLFPDIAAGSAK
ncbi:hypothetical protein RRG08_019217 [Elysia crispata]|uniref:Uncharacterized protein n=1 Tax=Elysia crispata TaxID=231223 RepID=A0AAE1ATB7_9GAST|nr:hypothetical protein RRG08_019217 [Elysia crispata]